jgi:hypothetical protein
MRRRILLSNLTAWPVLGWLAARQGWLLSLEEVRMLAIMIGGHTMLIWTARELLTRTPQRWSFPEELAMAAGFAGSAGILIHTFTH